MCKKGFGLVSLLKERVVNKGEGRKKGLSPWFAKQGKRR